MDIPLKAMIQTQKTEKVMIFFKTRNTSWSARISLAIPGSSTRCRTGYVTETKRSHHQRSSTGKRQIHKRTFPEEKEAKQAQVQNDQISQYCNKLHNFIYLVS